MGAEAAPAVDDVASGSRAEAIVPVLRLLAFRAVRPAPLPLNKLLALFMVTALVMLVRAVMDVTSEFAPLPAAPKLLRAPEAVVAPEPPLATPTVPVTLAAFPVMLSSVKAKLLVAVPLKNLRRLLVLLYQASPAASGPEGSFAVAAMFSPASMDEATKVCLLPASKVLAWLV